MKRLGSEALIAGQLMAMGYVLFTGPLWPSSHLLQGILVGGLLLGLWSVGAMKIRHVRIHPEPHRDAELCQRGPYRRVRHPMYTAVGMIMVGLIAAAPSLDRLLAGMALVVVIGLKTRMEEVMLTKTFAAYASYKQTTGAFFPRMNVR